MARRRASRGMACPPAVVMMKTSQSLKPGSRPTGVLTLQTSRCPFHTYTASADGLASCPRKRESRRRGAWGLDARLRGHDVLLVPDLRNGHLAWMTHGGKIY